jgi:glycosyltransferase involved in cell wall biosynthesis
MATTDKRLFFYYTGKLHNAYRHMVANPPEGFSYETGENMALSTTSGAASLPPPLLKRLHPFLSSPYNRLLIELGKPKTRAFDALVYDVVHSGQSILDTNRPYVMDFEHAAVFAGYNQFALRKPAFVRALKAKLLNKNLKRLTPWSNAARESLLNFVPDEELATKTETVYPVISPPVGFKKEKHDQVNFLFIGNVFYEKGALDALLAFESLAAKFDVTLTVVSQIPPEIQARFGNNPKIRLLPLQPYEKIKQLYAQSDVFVFPTHYDTFGFVIPEAMSYGLPVIGVDSFSSPELIMHECTGLIVRSFYSSFSADRGYASPTVESLYATRQQACLNPTKDYVATLAGAMQRLIEDGALLSKMAGNAVAETTEGKFSPAVWKKKMGHIYSEAL